MDSEILIVGSLNMDMVISLNRIPLVGETVLGKEITYVPGGKGANQAYVIGSLGQKATMLGCVGKDNLGNTLCKNLSSRKIDISHIRNSEEEPTGTAIIYVNDEGNNSIVVLQGANKQCDTEYLKKHDSLFEKCGYILLQMEIPEEAIYYVVNRAKELGKIVVLNPAPAPEYIPDEILEKIDYLTPNESELMHIMDLKDTELDSLELGARTLIAKGVKNVIVTLGEKGCLHASRNNIQYYPTRRVSAVDTTAAGDCFNGAFILALSEGKSETEAIRFANIAASIAVTRKGAQSSIPTRVEVERIIERN